MTRSYRPPVDLDRVRADLMVAREHVRHLEAMVRLAETLYGDGPVNGGTVHLSDRWDLPGAGGLRGSSPGVKEQPGVVVEP